MLREVGGYPNHLLIIIIINFFIDDNSSPNWLVTINSYIDAKIHFGSRSPRTNKVVVGSTNKLPSYC